MYIFFSMKRHSSIVLALALLPFLSVNAQQEVQSVTAMPSQWSMTREFDQTLPSDDSWWKSFNDTVLSFLVNKAETQNYNVAMAAKRIDISKRNINSTRAGYFPTIGINAGWTKDKELGGTSSAFSVGAEMNWEIDIFGRIREGVKAKKASWEATRMEYAGTMVSLAANVADSYFNLRMAQEELKVLIAHEASQKEVVDMTQVRFEAGLSNMLDVTQAKTVLYSTQAAIPTVKAQIEMQINNLALLLGEYPESLRGMLGMDAPMPYAPDDVAVGVPMDILRRRPDVVEAEFNLAAQAAAVGIAKKDFLPTLSLTGTIGTQTRDFDKLFGKNSLVYTIAPTLSWTLFDGMKRNYNVQNAKNLMEIAIDNYNLTVMTAFEEVENAMVQYAALKEETLRLNQLLEQCQESLKLSIELYKDGLSPFNDVMTSQENYLSYELNLIQTRGQKLIELVNLYKALGGGWVIADK